jgi:arsenate reductase
MAAALFNDVADPAKAEAASAGTRPGTTVHPEVRDAMLEIGIDLSAARPTRLTDDLARGVNMLITMGCGDECPYIPGVERADWGLPDPKGRPLEEVRAIRDDIKARVGALIASRGWGK